MIKDKYGRELRWRFEYYSCLNVMGSRKWYWRLKAGNGLIIADCGHGYAKKQGVLRALTNIKRPLYGVETVEVKR